MIASMRNFNGVVVFLSIICPRNFTGVRNNVIYPVLFSYFLLVVFDGFF